MLWQRTSRAERWREEILGIVASAPIEITFAPTAGMLLAHVAGAGSKVRGKGVEHDGPMHGSLRTDGEQRIRLVDGQRRNDKKNDAIGWANGRLEHAPFAALYAA